MKGSPTSSTRTFVRPSKCRQGYILGAIALVFLSMRTVPSWAAIPPWSLSIYRYLIVDQDLRTVLGEFGKNTGVRVALADGVKGRVKGAMPQTSPAEFLDTITKSYGLDWYYDGTVLYVSTVSEAETRFVDAHELSFTQMAEGLTRMGLTDARFTLRTGPTAGLVMVSGPPRYVRLVSDAIAAMSAQKRPAVDARVALVHVFRGSAATH